MNIRFTDIKIEGFQSLGKAMMKLDNLGVVIVKGINNYESLSSSNGSGKSSLFEAISWAIYGKTSYNITDPTNRYTNTGCMVDLRFSIDATNYRIVRSIKHHKLKTSLSLYKEDEDISGRNKTYTEDLIQNTIFKVQKDIFLSTILLSQGFSGRLSSLTPSGRKERIEILTETASVVDGFKDEFSSLKARYEKSLREKELDKVRINTTITSSKKQMADLEGENDRAKESSPEGVTKDSVNGKIDRNLSFLENLTQTLSDARSGSVKASSEMRQTTTRVNELSAKVREKKRQISDLNDGEDKKCPTCGQKITNEKYQELLDSYTSELEKIIADVEELNTKNAELTSEKEEFDLQISSLDTKYKKTSSDLATLREMLSKLSLADRVGENDQKINDLRKSVIELVKELDTCSAELENLETLSGIANHCVSLIAKQFRGYLLENTIAFMNKKLAEYSRQLFSNETDVINLVVDSTKLDIMLGDSPYDSLSGGEKKKVDIAIVFAQRDLAMNIAGETCNILVLDEILENLDNTAIEVSLDMIYRMSDTVDSLFIISHKDLTIPHDSMITVMKDQNRVAKVFVS